MKTISVYTIGNPLMDVYANIEDADLKALGINKGIMHLVDEERQADIIAHLTGKYLTYNPGGSAPNVAVTLASIGVSTVLAGKVGDDEYGKRYLDLLKERKVTPELKIGTKATGSSIILITPDAERSMNTHLGACQEFSVADVNEQLISQSSYFFFTGYMWDTENQKAAVTKAISLAKQYGTKIVFDVADPFAVNRYKQDFINLIRDHADVVFANKEEAKLLMDAQDPQTALSKLSALCDVAVVKTGFDGSLIKKHDVPDVITIPINQVTSKDTTGAGDTYAAGFLYGLCKNYALQDCGVFASYLASKIVEQVGAQFNPEQLGAVKEAIEKESWNYLKR